MATFQITHTPRPQLNLVDGRIVMTFTVQDNAAAAATAAAAQVAQDKQEIDTILPAIQQEGAAQVQSVQSAGTAAVESVDLAKTQALATIDPKVLQVTQDAQQVALDKQTVSTDKVLTEGFKTAAEAAANSIPPLLANFFDPAILALNSRIIADGATLEIKLWYVQLQLGEITI